jgi:uncharacterized tellurite resistance protein B-like protein
MLDRFLHLFDQRSHPPGAPPPARHRVAAAALLVEAARADGSFGGAERQRIERLLHQQFELEPEEADALLQAAEAAAEDSADWHGFTRDVLKAFDPAERVRLVEMLWEVAYADGVLHDYEASLLRRVGGLLHVSDRDRGEARLRVLRRMGIAG